MGTLSGPESSSLDRFIHQVNQAAVTIQRWYRCQVQRRRAGAASLEHLLASKREVRVAVGWASIPQGLAVCSALSAVLKSNACQTWDHPQVHSPLWHLLVLDAAVGLMCQGDALSKLPAECYRTVSP